MTNSPFEYEVALSFASEDGAAAEEFLRLLASRNINVFRDEYTGSEPWGKEVVDHLVNLYARKARYCVLLISRHYPLKAWTESERTSAQERALRDADEYIFPIQLDDTDVPGITEPTGYRDLRQHSVESIVNMIEEKLAETKEGSGPPSRSHDLRSGSVQSTDQKP